LSIETIAPPAPASVEGSLIRLLDYDPDLARHFGPAELPAASAAITVAARQAPVGVWNLPARRPNGLIGFLVLDGTLIRDVRLADRACAHLIGPGDVIDPWTASDLGPCGEATYRVLEEAQVAILNTRFVKVAGQYPQILASVMERLIRQTEQIGNLYALALLPRVDTRLIAFFWQIAGRWGRVGRDGVIIPLDLTHRTLGELVGGRRPTVSVALTELDQAGLLRRREDGSWALSRDSWKLLSDTPCPIDPTPVLTPAGPAA
jgi:CRP-like cAMP-binding protein